MKISMTEVYEVATFYSHFDVVKEGEAAPARRTIRVCDSIACQLAGAEELLAALNSRTADDKNILTTSRGVLLVFASRACESAPLDRKPLSFGSLAHSLCAAGPSQSASNGDFTPSLATAIRRPL